MNILVTGGAGFIGSHTVDALVQEGHTVRILDNLQKTVHPRGKPHYIHPEADFMLGDVRDKGVWVTALRDIDVVYHFAAYQDYLLDFSTFFNTNAVSTALLYEVVLAESFDKKIQKIIVASSQAVMGEGRYTCPTCFRKAQSFIYPAIRLEAQLNGNITARLVMGFCSGFPLMKRLQLLAINTPCRNILRNRLLLSLENDIIYLP